MVSVVGYVTMSDASHPVRSCECTGVLCEWAEMNVVIAGVSAVESVVCDDWYVVVSLDSLVACAVAD